MFESSENECIDNRCPVHNRMDDEYFDDEIEYARLISYIGDFVIYTTDNPMHTPPTILESIKMLLGCADATLPNEEHMNNKFVTAAYRVGSEGTLWSAREELVKGNRTTVFSETHDFYDNIKSAHNMVIEAIQGGTIGQE